MLGYLRISINICGSRSVTNLCLIRLQIRGSRLSVLVPNLRQPVLAYTTACGRSSTDTTRRSNYKALQTRTKTHCHSSEASWHLEGWINGRNGTARVTATQGHSFKVSTFRTPSRAFNLPTLEKVYHLRWYYVGRPKGSIFQAIFGPLVTITLRSSVVLGISSSYMNNLRSQHSLPYLLLDGSQFVKVCSQ